MGINEKSHIQSAIRTLDLAIEGLSFLRASASDTDLGNEFSKAVDIIHSSDGRLIVTGIGKSGLIARKLAATFSSTGTKAYFVHPSEAGHGDLGMIDRGDLVLALSWSGEPMEMAPLLTYAKRFQIPIISITSSPKSTLANASTIVLLLPKVQEACPHGLAPTTSTSLQLAIGDAIAVALLETRGFSALDFKVFHPGGKLGAQLTFVHDIMRTGEEVPLVKIGRSVKDAIAAMNRNSFGIVGIIDANNDIVGVVTDGDIRRNIHRDILTLGLSEIMTLEPKLIGPDVMAAEALEHMETQKVSSLFVVRNRTVIGFIRSHDLLKAGVR